MDAEINTEDKLTPKVFIDSMIRVGVIALLAVLCVRVFSPFVTILLWGLILAIMLYPMHQGLAKRIGGKQGNASTLIVVIGILLLGGPLFMLGSSFTTELKDMETAYENQELKVKQPDPGVAEWPIIGERVHRAWSDAATDLPQFISDHADQIKKLTMTLVSSAKSAVGSVFLFLGALIIAGIMMAWGTSGSNAMARILTRLAGPDRGPQLHRLSIDTVRSVATGVLGVAFIQALLFGIGFVLAGVPAAGLLALIVMFIGILQLPAIVVALPVIIFLWTAGGGSVTVNVIFTIYFLIAGLSDNVLKPLLLGRGVDAPMPIILIGALGGMIGGGFIGLFLGAILLALGYQIFMGWVNEVKDPETDTPEEPAPTEEIPGE